MSKTLFYVHDPMCSWCWAFRPVLTDLTERLPSDLKLKKLLGGLAPDSEIPMPMEMRRNLQATWQRIQQKLPATEFNFDFWSQCEPRRSTWPACRAVIAARQMTGDNFANACTDAGTSSNAGAVAGACTDAGTSSNAGAVAGACTDAGTSSNAGAVADAMILAIQQAYYIKAENPSELKTLVDLASRIGIDRQQFEQTINSRVIRMLLEIEINQSRAMGATSFPSLVLQEGRSHWPVAVDYYSVEPMLECLQNLLD